MTKYDPKEIAAWKEQIYGNTGTENRVEDWASTDQSHYTGSPRKSVQTKFGKSKNNDSYSSAGGDWLNGESPCGKKRTYKVKGEIKKPEL
jgi:hypothetical protein